MRGMKSRVTSAIALLVIAFCLCAHVSELLDTWDNTPQTGNDIELTIVVVVLSVGATLIAAGILIKLFNMLVGVGAGFDQHSQTTFLCRTVPPISFSLSPPPFLRV